MYALPEILLRHVLCYGIAYKITVLSTTNESLHSQIKTPLTLAVDIGCGSGQSTKCLAAHFENVLGIDVSSAQIQEAQNSNTHTNITYK